MERYDFNFSLQHSVDMGSDISGQKYAVLLLLICSFLIYLLTNPSFVSGDIRPSVELALNLATKPTAWPEITPEKQPWAFTWWLKTPDNKMITGSFSHWEDIVFGKSFSELQQEGKLRLQKEGYFVVPTKDNKVYANTFGPVPALVAAPFAWILKEIFPKILARSDHTVFAFRWISSFFAAITVAAVYLSACTFISRRQSLLIAIILAFGTSLWSTLSQGLFQQTVATMFLSLGVLSYLKSSVNSAVKTIPLDRLCGFFLGAAAATRTTSLLFLICLLGYELFFCKNREKVIRICTAASFPLIAIMAYNYCVFGDFLDFGQILRGYTVAFEKTGGSDLWSTPLLTGIAGLLFSPARGLLIYSPVLIFCLASIIYVILKKGKNPLKPIAVAFCIHLIVAAKWFDWWGGWTYGNRPLADALPLLVIPLVSLLPLIIRMKGTIIAFAGTLILSIVIQGIGAEFNDSNWNMTNKAFSNSKYERINGDCILREYPKNSVFLNIDLPKHRSRLWNWSESPIWYYFKNRSLSQKNRQTVLAELECTFNY